MSDNHREISFLRNRPGVWDWWGENPAEIILVVFTLAAFAFFYALPSQGWGIDPNPNVPMPDRAQVAE